MLASTARPAVEQKWWATLKRVSTLPQGARHLSVAPFATCLLNSKQSCEIEGRIVLIVNKLRLVGSVIDWGDVFGRMRQNQRPFHKNE